MTSTRGRVVIGIGIAMLAAAVVSPLEGLAGDLLSAHMVQHIVLGLVAPLAIVLGMRRPVRLPTTLTVATAVTAHAAVFWLWHAPALYDASIRNDALHGFEHMTMIATGLFFWWAVIGVARWGRPAVATLWLFLAGLQAGALGALLTLAPHPLYDAHLVTATRHGLTALEDQQIAGSLMWSLGGLVYVVPAVVLFVRWLRPRPAAVVAAAMVGTSLLGGCLGESSGRTARGISVQYGDAENGRRAVQAYGCGSCHSIPGVKGADGRVGPPLGGFGSRAFIAGELANTPDNLVRWLMHPRDVEPGTAMPDLGVSEQDARDITAYLEGLQ